MQSTYRILRPLSYSLRVSTSLGIIAALFAWNAAVSASFADDDDSKAAKAAKAQEKAAQKAEKKAAKASKDVEKGDGKAKMPWDGQANLNSPMFDGQANEAEPPKPDSLEFARAQIKEKDFKGALHTYEVVFSSSPYDADVLLGIAYCWEQLGDVDQAIKYARQAATAEPKSPEVHIALGHYLDENRDLRGAYLQYSRALDLKPARDLMDQIMSPTLRLLIAQNDQLEAVRLGHKWVHDYPKNAECHYNYAWVLSQSGEEKKLSEAVNSYLTAIQMDTSLVGAHYNVALLDVKLSRPDDAIDELNHFIKLAPHDSDVPQAKALLAKLKAQRPAQPVTTVSPTSSSAGKGTKSGDKAKTEEVTKSSTKKPADKTADSKDGGSTKQADSGSAKRTRSASAKRTEVGGDVSADSTKRLNSDSTKQSNFGAAKRADSSRAKKSDVASKKPQDAVAKQVESAGAKPLELTKSADGSTQAKPEKKMSSWERLHAKEPPQHD